MWKLSRVSCICGMCCIIYLERKEKDTCNTVNEYGENKNVGIVFVQLWLKASVLWRSPCVANKLTYFSNLMHFKRNEKRIRICEWWMVKCVCYVDIVFTERRRQWKEYKLKKVNCHYYRLYEWNYVNPWSRRITDWRIFISLVTFFWFPKRIRFVFFF